MSLLDAGAAWWLLLVPALVALYLFRPKPLRMPVSSLRLWKSLPQMDRPKARLRTPPRSLLLLLQVLILLAGSFALMQPALTAPAGKHLVIVLDASGSMQASDGNTSRFEEAKAEAHRLAASMGPGDKATLLRAGSSISTPCSACTRPDIDRAIDSTTAGASRANIQAALDVAAGLASREGTSSVSTVVISDGAYDPLAADNLAGAVHFIQVGSAAGNRAITVLSARQPPDGSPGYTAYARVENFGSSQASLQVSSLADTVPMPARMVTLPAGGHADIVWQVPAGTVKFTVQLSGQDAVAADDSAAIFLPAGGQHKVVVSAAQPDVYNRVLAGIPGLQPVGRDQTNGEQPAFSIIEGSLPITLPAGSLLLVNPEGNLLPSRGSIADARPSAASPDHPLLAGLDLAALSVHKANKINPPAWLETVIGSDQGPLLMAGELNGQRIAVLTFDLRDSNLPRLAAFPVLMANLADWLYPLAGTQAIMPGDTIYLGQGATVTTPDGSTSQVGATGLFAATDNVGVYTVKTGGASNSQTSFAVDMTDSKESGDKPQPHPELEKQATGTTNGVARQVFWAPLALLALLLVAGEWLLYCLRRGRA